MLLYPLLSCARMEAPSGGPEDTRPPVVVSTEPDTFAVVEDFQGPVVFRFSERISERPQGGTVEDAVVVSPPTSEVEVDFQRSAIEVSLEEGFEAGQVYRIRVNPVVVDMFSNPMVAPFELVFSTGADFSAGAVAGVVLDRITGEPVSDARVHARPPEEPETAPYVSRTDPDGIFAIRYLSPGSYLVTAFQDRNRSGDPDAAEARQSREVEVTSPSDTVILSMEVLAPDTTPPRVMDVEAVDSVTVRVEIDDFLDPAESLEPVEVTVTRQEGDAPDVDTLLHRYEWEARRDSLEALQADADTAAAPPPGDGAPAGQAPSAPPRSEQELYGILASTLVPGVEYVVSVSGLTNIQGTGGGGGEGTLVWEPPPPPDTTDAPPDGAGPDGADGPGADAADGPDAGGGDPQ
ncbi:MAG: Ig-like domain-containing protein [Longimicrobiales bacterium]|nr:Ig-like domain-containing protein [Longimicrobiales bacterium]